uniref:Uncharacterized protein n=1 Tax=Arundo donax TaxID=35708 RepID=A0A0A9DEH2_ARUDO
MRHFYSFEQVSLIPFCVIENGKLVICLWSAILLTYLLFFLELLFQLH